MSNYFKQLPDFDYVSRLPDAKISDYITVKNLFKRGELATDIFQNLAFFTKYEIVGNDSPDNVAYDTYGDPSFDWVVLLSNNIINIQSEWPMTHNDFNRFLLEKYGTYDKINATHHYQTKEVKNQGGAVVVPAELEVESDYSVTYYDWYLSKEVTKLSSEILEEVTNYEYEIKIENKKRDIFLLKPAYLPVVQDDLQEMMTYKEGSTQYLDETLKVAENIRLYQ